MFIIREFHFMLYLFTSYQNYFFDSQKVTYPNRYIHLSSFHYDLLIFFSFKYVSMFFVWLTLVL